MNNKLSIHKFLFFLLFILFSTSNCKKENNKPDGFSADFSVSYSNGAMVPDSLLFTADYHDADEYTWNISGSIFSGQNLKAGFFIAGNYVVSLTASQGDYSETETFYPALYNYPPYGTVASFLTDNDEIKTVVLSGAAPFVVSVDTVDSGFQISGGLDYDDEIKKLYYTRSLSRSNPNGTDKQSIFFTDPPEDFVRDVVVDSEDNVLYFSHSITQEIADKVMKISSVNLSTELLFEYQPSVDHLAINESENILFAVSEGNPDMVIYTPNEGLSFYSGHGGDKFALVWNNTENLLYYVEDIDGDNTYDIVKSDPTAANPLPEIVVSNASTQPILGIDIDEINQVLYWTDQATDAIYQIDLTNPQAVPKIAFPGISNPRALAIGSFGG